MEYERIRTFIKSFDKDEDDFMRDIRSEAEKRDIPIIRTDTVDFLKLMIQMTKPKRLLEVGMAVGYSTLLFAREISSYIEGEKETADKEEYFILTCENDPKMIEEAKVNFSKSGMDNRIHIIEGDAEESLKNLDGSYDMIFIDAAKAQYSIYMEEAIRLSHPGTVIICDNILGEGLVLESHFLVDKRDRTIHDRMRSFLEKIKEDERIETHILSIGDGMTVSTVR